MYISIPIKNVLPGTVIKTYFPMYTGYYNLVCKEVSAFYDKGVKTNKVNFICRHNINHILDEDQLAQVIYLNIDLDL